MMNPTLVVSHDEPQQQQQQPWSCNNPTKSLDWTKKQKKRSSITLVSRPAATVILATLLVLLASSGHTTTFAFDVHAVHTRKPVTNAAVTLHHQSATTTKTSGGSSSMARQYASSVATRPEEETTTTATAINILLRSSSSPHLALGNNNKNLMPQQKKQQLMKKRTGSNPSQKRKPQQVVVPSSFISSSSSKATTRTTVPNSRKHQQPFSSSSNNILQETKYPQTTSASNKVLKEKYSTNKLLTKEEEIRLANQLQTMRLAIRLRDELVKHDAVSDKYIRPTEQEWAKACGFDKVYKLRKVMLEGQEARSKLCSANLGLITSLANKYYASLKYSSAAGSGSVGTILTLGDMIQEGTLGLMEAAERFDPSKGFRFSTYAFWWIRQRILSSIHDYSRTIRLPAHVHVMLHKIRRAKIELQQELGTIPSLQQVAQKLGVSENKLRKYTASSRNVVSLEVPIHSTDPFEDSRTLGDTLVSDAPTPDEDAEAEYLRRDVWQVMETELSEQERAVILRRFGFHDYNPQTVAQTAVSLQWSRDRVRLVEARALNKLRHPQKNYRLREYITSLSTSSSSILRNGGHGRLIEQGQNMRGVAPNDSYHYNHASHHDQCAATTTTIQNMPMAKSSLETSSGASPRLDRMWFF